MKNISMVVLLAVCLFSCGEETPRQSGEDMSILEEWRAQKAAWEKLGINHYRYTARYLMDAAVEPPQTIVVFPDKEPEWMITPEEEAWYAEEYPDLDWRNLYAVLTISDIFDELEYNIVRLGEDEYIKITYNERYHYPEEYIIAPKAEASGGGWYIVKITAFEDLRER